MTDDILDPERATMNDAKLDEWERIADPRYLYHPTPASEGYQHCADLADALREAVAEVRRCTAAMENAERRCGRAEREKELGQLLREYGRHSEGCNGPFPPHKCKCGWDEIAKGLTP